jgi:transcriptional regulator with XRE-family HTH domain
MSSGPKPFGHRLRAKRLEKHYSLRKFAELVGVSPTYLSQVEQCNVMPPTADRVKRMAELLGQNADEWIALAGRVPEDLVKIVQESPAEVADLLRAVQGMTVEQLRKLCKAAERLKNKRE